MQRVYRKIITIGGSILLGLFVLLSIGFLGLMLYLKSDSGEKWLTSKTNSFLERKLDTDLNIESVKAAFPRDLEFHKPVIYDHMGDTLLVANQVDLKFSLYSFKIKSLIFANINLKKPRLYGRKYPGDSLYNYEYILNNIQDDDDEDGIYRVLFNGAQITNGKFVHQNLHEPREKSDKIDFHYLNVNKINGRADYFQLIQGKLSTEINHLQFVETSGFKVDEMRADLTFDNSTLSFQDLYLKTPYSEVKEQVTMEYDRKSDLNDFVSEVKLITRFKDSRVSLYDLSFLTTEIQRIDKKINFSGNVIGKVSDFDSKDFHIQFGEKTFFEGDFSINGLPDIQETFWDLKCNEARFQTKDFKYLFPDIKMPLNFKQLGLIEFKGEFIGFASDFVAYGDFNTDLGRFQTDINLKDPTNNAEASYSGKLILNNFNVGKLLDEPLLGKTSFEGNINGQGLTLSHLRAKLNANASRVHFKGYDYSNIAVEGEFTKGLFEGKLVMNDPNVGLNFQGTVNMGKTKPEFDFKADLNDADFKALNLVENPLLVDSRINMNFKASNPDDIEGKARLKNTRFTLTDRKLKFDSLLLTSVINSGHKPRKQLNLKSDIASVSLEGEYNLTSLDNIGKMTMKRLVNEKLVPGDTIRPVNENLLYQVHIKNASFLMELMETDLVLADDTKLAGQINTETGDLTVNGNVPVLYYKDWYLNDLNIQGSGSEESIFIKTDFEKLAKSDSLVLSNSNINLLRGKNDSLQFNIGLSRTDQKATLKGKMMADKEKITGRFYNSKVVANDSTWAFNSKKIQYFYDDRIKVPLLTLKHDEQRLLVTGEAGTGKGKPLRVLFDQVELGAITKNIFPKYKEYSGTLNGQVMLYDLLENPHFNSALMASPFKAADENLGRLNLNTHYNPDTRNINVEAGISNEAQKNLMSLKGYISFNEAQNLNLAVDFKETKLKHLEGLVDEYISDLKGTFVSGFNVKGTFEEPRINGKVDFNNASLIVNYLQTRYHFDHELTFNESRIPLENLKLKDTNQNLAVANGVIRHQMFDDFNLDIDINANNFKALNTTKEDNEIYYGKAYASGYVNFTGPLDDITIDMQLKSEKNTVVNLPVSDEGEYSGHEFIRFVNKKSYFKERYEVDFGGINLNIEMDITPDALVRIIFDPKAGDVLKGRGSGNIQMDITSAGGFNMYGGYTINQGDYLFTAFDIIKKRFKLKEGGTIKWNGNPYEAKMDIEAAYKVQASPAPLIPESRRQDQSSGYRGKVPVEAQLFLTGSLFSPSIDLDFQILNLEDNRSGEISTLTSQVKKIKNDEQALNQQVVSLLVMNRFYSVQSGTGLGAGQALESSSNSLVGDLISNQLTYWVSQFSEDIKYLEDVKLGINYQGRNKTTKGGLSEQELEVALSTTLFNDRVEISGSMDMESSEGNVEVSYKLTKEGKIRIKAFSRNNSNPVLNENIQTHGGGILWKKEFDSWEEFFSRSGKGSNEKAKQANKANEGEPGKDEEENPDETKPETDKGTLNREKNEPVEN